MVDGALLDRCLQDLGTPTHQRQGLLSPGFMPVQRGGFATGPGWARRRLRRGSAPDGVPSAVGHRKAQLRGHLGTGVHWPAIGVCRSAVWTRLRSASGAWATPAARTATGMDFTSAEFPFPLAACDGRTAPRAAYLLSRGARLAGTSTSRRPARHSEPPHRREGRDRPEPLESRRSSPYLISSAS